MLDICVQWSHQQVRIEQYDKHKPMSDPVSNRIWFSTYNTFSQTVSLLPRIHLPITTFLPNKLACAFCYYYSYHYYPRAFRTFILCFYLMNPVYFLPTQNNLKSTKTHFFATMSKLMNFWNKISALTIKKQCSFEPPQPLSWSSVLVK